MNIVRPNKVFTNLTSSLKLYVRGIQTQKLLLNKIQGLVIHFGDASAGKFLAQRLSLAIQQENASAA